GGGGGGPRGPACALGGTSAPLAKAFSVLSSSRRVACIPASFGFEAKIWRCAPLSRQASPEGPYSARKCGRGLRSIPIETRARPPNEARSVASAQSALTSK